MRRLFLSPALLALVACDTTLTERADAGPDVSVSNGAYVSAAATHDRDQAAPPIIAPLGSARSMTLATATRSPVEQRADAIAALEPMLGLVPGLVASLAAGDLAHPTSDLALPDSVASLTRAPWLVLDGQLVLADNNAVAESWSAGVPTLITRPSVESGNDGLFLARRPLAVDALPSAYRALRGATIKVFDHEREVCVARVGTLGLESRLVHNPDDWDDEGNARRADHDATAVFEMGGPMLVAALEPVIGTAADCMKGVWAAPVASVSPTLFRPAAMDKSLSRLAVRAFRKLDTWSQAQHDFATFFSDEDEARTTARWDATAKHEYTRWLASDGSREVLAVHADTWDGCGSSGQKLTALFDVVRTGKSPELRLIASRAWADVPAALVDVGADGSLELMNEDVMFRWKDGVSPTEDNNWTDTRYEELERLSIPDITQYGCGC